MNLGDFHSLVKGAVRRGDSADTIIPHFTRMAAKWLERNYTFQYMKQFLTVDIDPAVASTPRYIELGPGVPKAIPLFRWNVEGEYTNLRKVSPHDLDLLEDGFPEGYWLDGVRRIVLDKTPDEVLHGELAIDRYTPWPAELTFEHWLLDVAEDVMLGQTMLFMAVHLKDPRIRETYTQTRDEGLKTLLLAEDELQYGGQTAYQEFLPSK